MHEAVSLPCSHVAVGCTRPWANLKDGEIVVASRHGGVRHTNAARLAHLIKLALGNRMLSEADTLTIHKMTGEALRGNL